MLAVFVAGCSDTPSGSRAAASPNGRARLALSPVFSKEAARVYAQRATFADINFDHVRVVVLRSPTDTVKDTTIVFTPDSPAVTLDLNVEIVSADEAFSGAIQYAGSGHVVFEGRFAGLLSHAPDQPAPPQPQIPIAYVGPGATATRLVVSPKTVTLLPPAATTFTSAAFDANNTAVPAPVNWSSSDPTVATIGVTSGVLQPTGKRGTVTVTAKTPTGISDDARATITLPASAIVLVSGGGQTGKAGTTLPQPGVVRVTAVDGISVAGVSVIFAAPSGGKVGGANSTSLTTDANGLASVSLTLGSAVGPQSFAATAASASISIPETATAGDPASIVAVSGGGQQDTVRRTLKAPLVVRVTDQFGNPIGGVVVSWARAAGTGSIAAATSTTTADGLASVGYTLGTNPGSETINASIAGVSTPATFTVQALSAGPASIAIASGNNQAGRALLPLPSALVVRVADDVGNPVSGATVSWTAVNGTIAATTITDAQGQASNTLTVGGTVGSASATATVITTTGARSVTFAATIQAGLVARLAFRNNPPNGSAGVALTPAIQVELRDAAGNLTAAANTVSIALGANPGGATLTGTLTRNAAGGVATFDDLRLDKVGTGYTLVASSAGVPNVTSAAFNIGSGTAARFVIVAGDNQTAVVNTLIAIPPSVRVFDGTNNPVPGVGVTFTPSTGSGSVVPTTPVITDAQGIATVTSWTLGAIAGPQTLIVTAPGVPSATVHATAVPGSVARLVLITQPSPNPQSGVVFPTQPAVQLQDANGNPVVQAGRAIIASLGSGAGTLGGTLNVPTDASGRATFTDLKINGLVGNFTIVFASPPLISVASNIIALAPGLPTSVVFVQQPTNAAAGAAIAPPISVAVKDADNNTVTTANNSITVAIAAGTGASGAVLSGPTTISASNGIATFPALRIDKPATNYRLTATAAGLTSATSDIFAIITTTAVTYDASLNTLPQAQGWSYTDDAANPAPVVSGGVLIENTTNGTQYWTQINPAVDFTRDFVIQATLRVDSSSSHPGNLPGDTGTREGYYLFITDGAALNYTIGIASAGLSINTIQVPNRPLVQYPVANGQFHVFRLVVHASSAILSIDGTPFGGPITPVALGGSVPGRVVFGGVAGISKSLTALKSVCYGTAASDCPP